MRVEDVATVPLFDRLVDAEKWTPRETKPLRAMDRAALRLSVANEVERLLNTRCSLTVEQAVETAVEERTVLDYGIPDLAWLNPMSTEDSALLIGVIRNALLAYEPRLQNPRVLVMGLDARQRSVLISILGVLRIGRVEEPFSFACALDQASQAPVGVGDTYAA